MNTKEKCVVLSSGGIDSTTCLVVAINQYGPENVDKTKQKKWFCRNTHYKKL